MPKKYIIGRALQADIILVDTIGKVSRQHASIEQINDKEYILQDLHSSNGTFINGQQLAIGASAKVSVDDNIMLGSCMFNIKDYFQKPSETIQPNVKNGQTITPNNNKTFAINLEKTSIKDLSNLSTDGFKSIGRAKDNDIVINNEFVSRYHARIRQLSPLIFEIIDLNSANKTFLDGKVIEANKNIKFQSNAEIRIGNVFIFELPKYFDNVSFVQKRKRFNSLDKGGQMADAELMTAFNELEAIWAEYKKRNRKVASLVSKYAIGGSAAGIGSMGVLFVAGPAASIPAISIMLIAGGGIIGRWLGERKRNEISEDTTYEDIFLETYACPNCKTSFGKRPWVTIRECFRCKVVYKL